MSKIIYSDYYIPSNTVLVKDILLNSKDFLASNSLTDINEAADKFITNTGIKEVTVEKDGDIIDIFSTMLNKMFVEMDIEPKKIKNIFYTSDKHYDYNDCVSVPYYLQEKYKLSNATVMTLNQLCSSTLQAIRIADSLNKSEKGAYSLIISPCFLDKGIDRYAGGVTIIGDGASIMLIGDDDCNEGFKIIDTISISDGRVSYYCYDNFNKSEKDKYDNLKIRLITLESIAKASRKMVNEYEEWFKDSKFIIGQNVSSKYLKDYLMNYLNNVGKTYQNYHGGHIEDVDITRNLRDVMDSVKFEKGDKIVLFGQGSDFKCVNSTSIFCQYE
ncbi:hypothetical protein KPL47_16920 [Clostridium estertheticum]|uniref:hypothetical protein n=1 Tax=Clostridium estertheticum TaxID=238834 RepID=UPI001C0A942E|nr:hypothetical protein [Clostridium estertheticum]MBU3178013.1 hypothetical protein [Clostridium estertheticum]